MGFRKTAPILKWQKMDDGGLSFDAIFSSETPDSQGDIVLQSATMKAVERWKAKNIREMHQPIAVGKAIEFDFPADGTSHLKGHITAGAPLTVKKVEDDVLKMMSIAGPPPTKTSKRTIGGKTYRVFEEYDLDEMSLVDNGANPDAWISVIKAVGLDAPEAPEPEAQPLTEGEPAPEPVVEPEPVSAPEKAAEPEVKKYDGMAAYDVRLALDCLAMLEQLMSLESGEAGSGKPEPPKQMKALAAACAALKEFIASEAQELLEGSEPKKARGVVVMKFDAPAPQEIDLDALAAKVAALIPAPIEKSAPPAPEPDARIETVLSELSSLQKTVGGVNAVTGDLKAIRDEVKKSNEGIEKMLAQPAPGRSPMRMQPAFEKASGATPVNEANILRRIAAGAPPSARDFLLNEANAIERG